ncbi:MAG: aminoglycoside phosphotransferase family protein [Limisphaerales bacterium]
MSQEFLIANGVPQDHSLEQLTGGANNRVYQVTAGDRSWVLKQYFKREGDPRDRFAAEQDYYTALWAAGIRQIPEPLAWDREQNLGLFEYLDGRKLKADEVGRERIDEALKFLIETNQRAGDADLKPASEACFSLEQHFATVERRIQRLQGITDAAAKKFVDSELTPKWRSIADRSDQSDSANLTVDQRCISPSDFGFHNALLQADNTLRFFDFEYAGADDPAKLTCDFFCQPRLPASLDHWVHFVQWFATECEWDDRFLSRADRLLPVYQIKWCCIMLNEFLKADAERREFSAKSDDLESRKATQLELAQSSLAAID